MLLGLLIRVVPLTLSHFWDEAVYLQHARVILDGRGNYEELHHRPPLLPFLYALGFALWDDVYVANIVQGVACALSILFGYLYVRTAFGGLPAILAAALFAFTPYFVASSHVLLTDIPAVALMLAAMWLFDRPGTRAALAAGVVSALAVEMRFTSLFVLAYFAIDAIVSGPRWRRLAYLLAGAIATIGPYLIWVRWKYGSFFHTFEHASRITREWTMPVPAVFYAEALPQIFPASMGLFFVAGILFVVARTPTWDRADLGVAAQGRFGVTGPSAQRAFTLLAWGLAFLLYMLTIPHKEVRYLLPLAIPVVVISAVGLAGMCEWVMRRGNWVRGLGLALGFAVAAIDYGPALAKLAKPWVDPYESETVRIARYLRQISTAGDTIYAAHDFPVLAYYSGRSTISVLPIQESFDREWRQLMNKPGYFVYFHPEGIGETHSRVPSFMPDKAFLESNPQFDAVKRFPGVTVYRYAPKF